MRLPTLLLKELFERPVPMVTCLLAIALGVTAVVAVRTVTMFSEAAVARELDSLGANVLILPKGVSLQDYYAADLHGETLPDEYIQRITRSKIQGVDNLSPKLCITSPLVNRTVTLTGIIPKSEFQAKSSWGGAGIFAHPIGCGSDGATETVAKPNGKRPVIETLGENEVLVGADAATKFALNTGQSIKLFGEDFRVLAVLPTTGTVDDSRVFAHLDTVQRLSGKGKVVNVIEIVGCCKQIANGLVDGLNKLLPEAKVVTISQVVQTQQNVNRLMERLSLIFVAVLIGVGGAALASTLFGNVSERRKEIGTLMALGATPDFVMVLVVGKAILLGIVGGIVGYLGGSFVAMWLGPQLANVTVRPIPAMAGFAVSAAVFTAMLASVIPAWRASRLDPCQAFKEV